LRQPDPGNPREFALRDTFHPVISPPVIEELAQKSFDQASPERWVDDHGDCLFRYALARVRSATVAEDLVQDTFLAAVKAQDHFGGRSSVRSWLCGILKNKIADYFRTLGRETSFTDLEFFSDEHSEKFDDNDNWIHELGPTKWKGEGEEALDREEFWQALRECLAKLPPRVADVFLQRDMEEVPSKELCANLKISESNLWVMLHRARMALRQCLELNFFAKSN